jgi:hypothetical protein
MRSYIAIYARRFSLLKRDGLAFANPRTGYA